jgi:hypothetical protein
MKSANRLWSALMNAIVALALITCACGTSLDDTFSNKEAIPGLAGKWLDPDTVDEDIHTIAWQGDKYEVTSSVSSVNNEVYTLTSQSWQNGTLTWTYYVPSNQVSVTTETVRVSGDSLLTKWSNDTGDSGRTTMQRVRP